MTVSRSLRSLGLSNSLLLFEGGAAVADVCDGQGLDNSEGQARGALSVLSNLDALVTAAQNALQDMQLTDPFFTRSLLEIGGGVDFDRGALQNSWRCFGKFPWVETSFYLLFWESNVFISLMRYLSNMYQIVLCCLIVILRPWASFFPRYPSPCVTKLIKYLWLRIRMRIRMVVLWGYVFGFMALSPDPYADPHGRPFVVMLQRASFICIFHAGSVMSLLIRINLFFCLQVTDPHADPHDSEADCGHFKSTGDPHPLCDICSKASTDASVPLRIRATFVETFCRDLCRDLGGSACGSAW